MSSPSARVLEDPDRARVTGSVGRIPPPTTRVEARLFAWLQRPQLTRWLVAFAFATALPSLFIGFELDDYIGRYIYSDLPGAARLYELYGRGYGLANGNPIDNHWQIEAGHAPWWTYPRLRLVMYRPLSLWTHLLDAKLWPNNALLMHAHSIAWLLLFIAAATRFYRGLLGPLAGGMAALLLAFDHTKALEVGFICNRHALITACFGVLCLDAHHRSRERRSRAGQLGALALYVATLLSGEAGIAIGGYLFAYALCMERGRWGERARSFAPYLAATLIWRVAYNAAGYGGYGSGIYIDPGREPLHFALAFLERAPFLCLAQFFVPPAELYPQYGPAALRCIWAAGLGFIALFIWALVPSLRSQRSARFWALSFALSLVPASSTTPHNRLLLLSSIAAMGLVAQLWQATTSGPIGATVAIGAGQRRVTGALGGAVLFIHLFMSPLFLPLGTCGVALAAPMHRAADDVGPEIAGKDVVFVSAPEYFAVRLVQLRKRLEHKPLPRRWRALSFGPRAFRLTRSDARTLLAEFPGGILQDQMLELFRDRRLPMHVGERIELEGLTIDVLALTRDGRAERVRFAFDAPLDTPQFVFYRWSDRRSGFEHFAPPSVGQSVWVPAAKFDVWNRADIEQTAHEFWRRLTGG